MTIKGACPRATDTRLRHPTANTDPKPRSTGRGRDRTGAAPKPEPNGAKFQKLQVRRKAWRGPADETNTRLTCQPSRGQQVRRRGNSQNPRRPTPLHCAKRAERAGGAEAWQVRSGICTYPKCTRPLAKLTERRPQKSAIYRAGRKTLPEENGPIHTHLPRWMRTNTDPQADNRPAR